MGAAPATVDSRMPRFSQAVQAAVLAAAFLLNPVAGRWAVAVVGVVLVLAVVGGPAYNVLALIYRALPIPPGEPEAAAPPRFAQTIGAVFLVVGSVVLFAVTVESALWWVLGWGPALAVAVLSALAATTSF